MRLDSPFAMIRLGVLVALAMLLAGCAGSRQDTPAKASPHLFASVNGAADETDTAGSPGPEYRVGAGDVLEIKFFKNGRFTTTQTVRPDGRVTLERIGDVLVKGKTPTEIDLMITDSYRSFILDPELTVFVRGFESQSIFVLGEVESPGGYPLTGDINYLQALALAGGAKNTAKLSSVIIMRKQDNGEVQARRVNLLDFAKDPATARSRLAQGQDIVYVPKTFIGSASNFMSQLYSTILPPVDVYLRAILWSR